jgi:hypothetical protein
MIFALVISLVEYSGERRRNEDEPQRKVGNGQQELA